MRVDDFRLHLLNLPENFRNFEYFFEELKIGNCVALVGAGLSNPIGIPKWEDLIFELSEFSCLEYTEQYIKNDPEKWLDIAEEAKNYWEKKRQLHKYYGFLQDKLSPINTNFNNTHLVLLEADFLSYLTTNFDNILENAAKRVNNGEMLDNIQIFPSVDPTLLRHRKLFYLHGKIKNRIIVFTRTEYYSAYNKHRGIKDVLWDAYSHMSMVLIGFSLRDSYIRNLFKNFKEQLDERRKEEEQLLGEIKDRRAHFAFTGTDVTTTEEKIITEENFRYKELGIYIIRYQVLPEDNHINLERILEKLPKFRKVRL